MHMNAYASMIAPIRVVMIECNHDDIGGNEMGDMSTILFCVLVADMKNR